LKPVLLRRQDHHRLLLVTAAWLADAFERGSGG
jgi:hypothetical protein